MTKHDTLADLTRRIERAALYAEEADAAGDEDKRDRAVGRYFLRLQQWIYTDARPDNAFCIICRDGETGWAPDFWQSERPVYLCLEHAADGIRRDAEEQFTTWADEDAPRDMPVIASHAVSEGFAGRRE